MKNGLSCLLWALCVSVAAAEAPARDRVATEPVVALVTKQLLRPLQKAERRRSPFSREDPPPAARRVRVTDTTAQVDARGKSFVRFAVDARYRGDEPSHWQLEVLIGCVYVDQNEVYLQRGKAYVPASAALGDDAKSRRDVCTPEPGAASPMADARP